MSILVKEMVVPKVLHQIWYNFREWGKCSSPPKDLVAITDQWLQMNPDWDYMLWNEEASIQLLAHFYPNLLEKFLAFKRPIQRADFFRWAAIYHFGGVFIDFDCVPLKPLHQHPKISEKLNRDLLVVPASAWCSNAMIAATPKHTAVAKILTEMKIADPWPFTSHNSVIAVFTTTGPWLVNRALKLFSKDLVHFEENLLLHGPSGGQPSDRPYFVRHLGKGSWGYSKALWTDIAQIIWLVLIIILFIIMIIIFSKHSDTFRKFPTTNNYSVIHHTTE